MAGVGSQDPSEIWVANARFLIEIEAESAGKPPEVAGFTEFSGGGLKMDNAEFKHGNDTWVRRRPVKKAVDNFTLKGVYTGDVFLQRWWEKVLRGEYPFRRNVSVIVLGDNGEEVGRYNYFQCYPIEVKNPALNSMDTNVLFEEITICAERMEYVGPAGGGGGGGGGGGTAAA